MGLLKKGIVNINLSNKPGPTGEKALICHWKKAFVNLKIHKFTIILSVGCTSEFVVDKVRATILVMCYVSYDCAKGFAKNTMPIIKVFFFFLYCNHSMEPLANNAGC